MKKIDVIVPCYNEEERVAKVLRVLTESPYIKKIIVVDDGSTDDTYNVAKRFHKAEVIKIQQNIGKGGAVKEGLKNVDTDTVFLSDADLKGFKEKHIEALIEEYFKNHTPTIGLRDRNDGRLLRWLRLVFFFNVDGQRVLPTQDLKEVLKSKHAEGFGLEAWMNYYFRKEKIKPNVIPLNGLFDGPVKRKGFKSVALEIADIGETYLEIYKDTLKKALT